MGATARFLLRAGIATALAGLGAAAGALTDGGITVAEAITIATAALTAAGIYAGVGAAVPQVEPHIGNKMEPTP